MLYLGVVAFLLAVGGYLVVRLWLRVKAALIVMAPTLTGLLAGSVLVLWYSLTYVM